MSVKTERIKWGSAEILIPIGLGVLSIIPVAGGTYRMLQLISGAEITADNARFFAAPVPILMHISSFIVYATLGAAQFMPRFRQRHPRWHRWAGRVLIPCGLVAALTGLWMTLFYPWPEGDGLLLYVIRLVFGTAMLVSLVLGIIAIRRRNFARHGDWMLRAYAIGIGAGTQVFTLWFGEIAFGAPTEFPRAMLMGTGWVINILIAEAIIRK